MNVFNTITNFLVQDIALWGEMKSPMLSWVGSGCLIVFFLWQVTKLRLEARRTAEPFLRLQPLLTNLAEKVEASDIQHAFRRAFSEMRESRSKKAAAGPEETDLDKLTDLDKTMRDLGAFRRPWVQFRKTLLIEHVPWFREPRIYSTRRADEFFTQEAVLGGQLDLGFYNQIPSLITGMGLLLTFVAICLGLSRLHADGQTITGIQGLINGLAGKFITSIVGLVCANLFVLVEKPIVRRLDALHRECLALLDESFPRRTVEDLLDALGSRGKEQASTASGENGEKRGEEPHPSLDQLKTPIEVLTRAVNTLSARMQSPRGMPWTEISSELAQALQTGIHGPIKELNQAVHGMTQAMQAMQAVESSQLRYREQVETLTQRIGLAPVHANEESPAFATSAAWPADRLSRWAKVGSGEPIR
jgi:hypothetical protein